MIDPFEVMGLLLVVGGVFAFIGFLVIAVLFVGWWVRSVQRYLHDR